MDNDARALSESEQRPLYAGNLMDDAMQQTALVDFGADRSFLVGLRRLINAVEAEAPSAALRADARGRILNALTTRLHLVEDDRRHPEIRALEIEKPLIITGLPRSGTTVTYDMLALDKQFRYPREWEWLMPWPATEAAHIDDDPRIAMIKPLVDRMAAASPELASIVHRLDCTAPGECNAGMMYHFSSSNFAAELGANGHAEWLSEHNPEGLYRDHKRLLQQMQWKGPPGRWLLKSPQHLCDLPALFETYPDARIVWTHRDPVSTFSSLSSMTALLHHAVGIEPDQRRIGTTVVKLWSKAILNALAARAAHPEMDVAIIDIPHRDIGRDPKAVVARIYNRFDIAFSDDFSRQLAAFIGGDERASRLGKHRHKPEDFGIDAGEVRRALRPYYDRFGEMMVAR